MKRIRRDKLKIYGDLLSVLHTEVNTDKIVLSRIQVRVNVPFDRLKNYIHDLSELGLIEDEVSLKLTEKGRHFVKEYEKVLGFIKIMGITYR